MLYLIYSVYCIEYPNGQQYNQYEIDEYFVIYLQSTITYQFIIM